MGRLAFSPPPPESIFAEKLETAVSRGILNSRMKDYHDLFMLVNSEGVLDSLKTSAAVKKTFKNRQTSLNDLPLPLSENSNTNLDRYWKAYLKKMPRDSRKKLPSVLNELISKVNTHLIDIGLVPNKTH